MPDTHEFIPSPSDPEVCNYGDSDSGQCALPARAGVHLVTPVIEVKSWAISFTDTGVNIAITGVLDPTDLALASVIAHDMCIQAIRGATSAARPVTQDHKKKGWVS